MRLNQAQGPDMLARTFLPAANLKISEKQRDALIAVLLLFEGGEVKHGPVVYRDLRKGEQRKFNMAEWDCGTACCIGGWADQLGGAGFDEMAKFPVELERLFFPPLSIDMHDVTVPQAARAVRRYLETGAVRWNEMVAA